MNDSGEVSAMQDALLANMRSGHWEAGKKLPTERELSETYQIGRSVVRRVLARLKERGLITQTVGSGTYVCKEASSLLQTAQSDVTGMHTSPADLMEARVLIEPMIATLVVRNGTNADFLHMDACCANAERAESLEQFEYWDGALHQAIADATHNGFIKNVFQLMSKAREQGEWGQLKKKSLTPERRKVYQAQHRALVAALRERDAERAKLMTMEHLLHVRHNLLGY